MVSNESFEFVEECVEAFSIVLANLESRINEDIGYVMVACKDTRNESIEGLGVLNKVFFGVDKTAAVVDIKLQLVTLFDADYGTISVVESFIEATIDGDADEVVDLLPEDFVEKMARYSNKSEVEFRNELEKELLRTSATIKDVDYEIIYTDDVSGSTLSSYRERYLMLGYYIEDVKEVAVSITMNGETDMEDFDVVQSDGDWYIHFQEVN